MTPRLLRGVVLGLLLSAGTGAHAGERNEWQFSGDARGGLYASERRARDGERSREDELRLRLRLATEREITPQLRVRGRLAGTFASEQSGFRFQLRNSASGRSGLEAGEATVDELHLHYRARTGDWWLTAGRFQSRFLLPGVASKSLDRNDGSNVGVNWRDGVHFSHALPGSWRSHLVLEHRPSDGGGSVHRAPLEFSQSASRVGMFAGLASNASEATIMHRMIGLTWLPDSLASDGIGQPRRDDYVTLVGRIAAGWPLGSQGMRLLAGAEAGIAPTTQRLAGTRASGVAWQVSVNLQNIRPGHHLGLVHGQAGAGWLLSTDYRNNDRLTEIRYQRRFNQSLSLEARARLRRELEVPAATRHRTDRDIYVRLSARF